MVWRAAGALGSSGGGGSGVIWSAGSAAGVGDVGLHHDDSEARLAVCGPGGAVAAGLSGRATGFGYRCEWGSAW